MKLDVHQPLIVIYIYLKFHKILFKSPLVMAPHGQMNGKTDGKTDRREDRNGQNNIPPPWAGDDYEI